MGRFISSLAENDANINILNPVLENNVNANRFIPFVDSTTDSSLVKVDSNLTFNSSLNELYSERLKSSKLVNNFTELESKNIILNSTLDPQVIDNLFTVNFDSAEYTIQAFHPEYGKQISKLNVMYDVNDADSVEYGIVFTQIKLVEYTIFYSGSTIQIMADPNVPDIEIKFFRTILT